MTAVKRSVKGTKKIVGRTKKDYVITACFYIILALVAAICLFPFLHPKGYRQELLTQERPHLCGHPGNRW